MLSSFCVLCSFVPFYRSTGYHLCQYGLLLTDVVSTEEDVFDFPPVIPNGIQNPITKHLPSWPVSSVNGRSKIIAALYECHSLIVPKVSKHCLAVVGKLSLLT